MNATQQGSARPAPGPRGELSARYLVLFGDALAPRAALFGAGDRLLTELIEHDDYVLDTLVRSSTACAPPRPAMLDALTELDARARTDEARCFRLD
jgi:hypothetical protein